MLCDHHTCDRLKTITDSIRFRILVKSSCVAGKADDECQMFVKLRINIAVTISQRSLQLIQLILNHVKYNSTHQIDA